MPFVFWIMILGSAFLYGGDDILREIPLAAEMVKAEASGRFSRLSSYAKVSAHYQDAGQHYLHIPPNCLHGLLPRNNDMQIITGSLHEILARCLFIHSAKEDIDSQRWQMFMRSFLSDTMPKYKQETVCWIHLRFVAQSLPLLPFQKKRLLKDGGQVTIFAETIGGCNDEGEKEFQIVLDRSLDQFFAIIDLMERNVPGFSIHKHVIPLAILSQEPKVRGIHPSYIMKALQSTDPSFVATQRWLSNPLNCSDIQLEQWKKNHCCDLTRDPPEHLSISNMGPALEQYQEAIQAYNQRVKCPQWLGPYLDEFFPHVANILYRCVTFYNNPDLQHITFFVQNVVQSITHWTWKNPYCPMHDDCVWDDSDAVRCNQILIATLRSILPRFALQFVTCHDYNHSLFLTAIKDTLPYAIVTIRLLNPKPLQVFCKAMRANLQSAGDDLCLFPGLICALYTQLDQVQINYYPALQQYFPPKPKDIQGVLKKSRCQSMDLAQFAHDFMLYPMYSPPYSFSKTLDSIEDGAMPDSMEGYAVKLKHARIFNSNHQKASLCPGYGAVYRALIRFASRNMPPTWGVLHGPLIPLLRNTHHILSRVHALFDAPPVLDAQHAYAALIDICENHQSLPDRTYLLAYYLAHLLPHPKAQDYCVTGINDSKVGAVTVYISNKLVDVLRNDSEKERCSLFYGKDRVDTLVFTLEQTENKHIHPHFVNMPLDKFREIFYILKPCFPECISGLSVLPLMYALNWNLTFMCDAIEDGSIGFEGLDATDDTATIQSKVQACFADRTQRIFGGKPPIINVDAPSIATIPLSITNDVKQASEMLQYYLQSAKRASPWKPIIHYSSQLQTLAIPNVMLSEGFQGWVATLTDPDNANRLGYLAHLHTIIAARPRLHNIVIIAAHYDANTLVIGGTVSGIPDLACVVSLNPEFVGLLDQYREHYMHALHSQGLLELALLCIPKPFWWFVRTKKIRDLKVLQSYTQQNIVTLSDIQSVMGMPINRIFVNNTWIRCLSRLEGDWRRLIFLAEQKEKEDQTQGPAITALTQIATFFFPKNALSWKITNTPPDRISHLLVTTLLSLNHPQIVYATKWAAVLMGQGILHGSIQSMMQHETDYSKRAEQVQLLEILNKIC